MKLIFETEFKSVLTANARKKGYELWKIAVDSIGIVKSPMAPFQKENFMNFSRKILKKLKNHLTGQNHPNRIWIIDSRGSRQQGSKNHNFHERNDLRANKVSL